MRRSFYRVRRKRRKKYDKEIIFFIVLAIIFTYGMAKAGPGSIINILPSFLYIAIFAGIVSVFVLAYRRYRAWEKKEERYRAVHSSIDLAYMDPFEFERFVGWLFKHEGYSVEVTKERGDHGIDVVLTRDGREYAVQVKRYMPNHRVGEEEIRDFYGSYVGKRFYGGFFVTTSDFSTAARLWAKEREVVLMNGRDLIHMIHKEKE